MRNALRRSLPLLIATWFSLSGCGSADSELSIMLEHDVLPADGLSETTITVSARFRGDPVSGSRVNLTTSAGSFDDRGRQTATVDLVGGSGTIRFKAPYEHNSRLFIGDVTISASYDDPYRITQEAVAILSMIAPPPIDGQSFRFSCSARNVQRPAAGTSPVRIPCSVQARDVNGRNVPVDSIRFGFLSEAGRMEISSSGDLEWVLSAGDRPKNVEPLGDSSTGEPRWVDQAVGVTRNPRDGIATLVVHAQGTPTGSSDPIQGEPFVDENDDGIWNPGEPYYDANENGEYDAPTGSMEERRIWRWAKIMVTGPVDENALENAEGISLWDTGSYSRQNVRIPRSGDVSISLLLLDENLNPVASHPGRSPDTIQITASPRGVVASREAGTQSLRSDAMGLSFDEFTGRIIDGENRSGYLQGNLSYTFRLSNTLSDDADGNVPWSMDSAEIKRTPSPSGSTITERLSSHDLPRGYLD